MAITPEGEKVFKVVIKSVKGHCGAGHEAGQELALSSWDPGGLCGYFYHDIFPNLAVFQFGGNFPWSPEGVLTLECPDRHNLVTLELSRD
jgi:uncharacterized repeat protein (TIGR04076 family)